MSGGNNQGEPAFVLLMMMLLLGGLCWLLWHSTQYFWIDYFFRWLRYVELWPINLIRGGHYDACLVWLHYGDARTVNPNLASFASNCFGANYLAQLSPDDQQDYYRLSMPALNVLGAEVDRYYRWLIAIPLVGIIYLALFKSPKNKFQTKHTLESFIETQAKMWPVITPIVKFNPSKTGRILGGEVPDKLPMFAEPLSPEEWVAWNRIPLANGQLDRDAARRAFIQQLGPRWTGIDKAPTHIRALFAAFAARGAQKRDESEELLGRLALAWSPDKGFKPDAQLLHDIDRLIKDPEAGGKALSIANQHAWRTTALLGVLKWARATGGVLAPAQFLWVRAEDRALWYPLNNMGRRSFHSEGAGALAHFMAEQAAQKPLPIPRIDNAYVTLHNYLFADPERKPLPIPPREGGVKA